MDQGSLALARDYEEQERYQEALAEYGRVVQASPNDAEPLLAAALCLPSWASMKLV